MYESIVTNHIDCDPTNLSSHRVVVFVFKYGI